MHTPLLVPCITCLLQAHPPRAGPGVDVADSGHVGEGPGLQQQQQQPAAGQEEQPEPQPQQADDRDDDAGLEQQQRQQQQGYVVFDYSICYSHSYRVPLLYFRGREAGEQEG